MKQKTMNEVYHLIQRIEKDAKYVLRVSISHEYENLHSLTNMGELYQHATIQAYTLDKYVRSILKVAYFNKMGILKKYQTSFVIEPFITKEQSTELNIKIKQLNESLSAKNFFTDHLTSPMYNESWKMTAQALFKMEPGISLYQALEALNNPKKICTVNDMVVKTRIRAHLGKSIDTRKKSTYIFDYASVEVPIIQYSYTKEEILNFIKTFKKDIDAMVIEKLNARLESTGVPINFLELTNLTLRQDSVLQYTFSLREPND